MEKGDLYLRIGPLQRNRRCPLAFRWISDDDEWHEVAATLSVPERGIADLTPSSEIPDRIVEALSQHLLEHHGVPPGQALGNLLLDVRASDLYAVDWEAALRRPRLPAWNVTRFVDRSDEWIGIPFELPARVLRAGEIGQKTIDVTVAERRYFRVHRIWGAEDKDLLFTLRGGRFDIAHLVVRARWSDEPVEGCLTIRDKVPPDGPGIKAKELAIALKASGVRFLVLECTEGSDYEPLLDLAHRIQAQTGPTTALFQSVSPAGLEQLYMDIVHDEALDQAVRAASASAVRTALFEGIAGASVLSIAPFGNHLIASAEQSVKMLMELDQQRRDEPRPELGEPDVLEELRGRAAGILDHVYNTAHETGAWIPMGNDARELAQLREELAAEQAARGRVVNVGLLREGKSMTSRESLAPGGRYELSVQVGRAASWTLVKQGRPIPETALADHYVSDGLSLRVVVSAKGFEIEANEATLLLPRPPRESDLLRLPLRAPQSSGSYRIRVGLYHENNLLQSVLMRVQVVSPGAMRPRGAAIQAEVEFALSERLTDPGRLPRRTVNFLSNAGDDGTHTFLIVGNGFKKDFDFGEGQMRSAVDAARKALYDIAADRSSGKPRYRFDAASQEGSLQQLGPDMIRLAERGHTLFSSIVTAEDRDFKATLLDALGTAGATIQVSATKSARYVFPWAIVYDHPLVVGGTTLCRQFVADLQASKPLASAACFSTGCPHRDDTTVICPSGFWGFKHLLEQPLSVKTKPGPTGPADLLTELAAGPAGQRVRALMALSRELEQVGAHEKEVRGDAAWQFDVKDTKAEVLINLQAAAQMRVPLVYFYCHGGRTGSDTWLGIGRGERLVPADLEARDIDWSVASPLVLINGCHTADLTPDDLLSFNQVLGWCRAAGVIGTEIDVTESLARDFAKGFLQHFASGETVGESMRRHRLSLLARCNPLGLAYTPYCSASLHLVRQ